MSACRNRASAIVALIALLGMLPVPRPERCDVCPTDCPMHARRPGTGSDGGARHVGCHRVSGPRATTASPDDGRCSMRGGCGWHRSATTTALRAVLEVPVGLVEPFVGEAPATTVPAPVLVLASPPPVRPPELLSI